MPLLLISQAMLKNHASIKVKRNISLSFLSYFPFLALLSLSFFLANRLGVILRSCEITVHMAIFSMSLTQFSSINSLI